jgi:hypothetical protein
MIRASHHVLLVRTCLRLTGRHRPRHVAYRSDASERLCAQSLWQDFQICWTHTRSEAPIRDTVSGRMSKAEHVELCPPWRTRRAITPVKIRIWARLKRIEKQHITGEGQDIGQDGCTRREQIKTLWLESASELYRSSDRPLSTKLVPHFAVRVCHVVSATDSLISAF